MTIIKFLKHVFILLFLFAIATPVSAEIHSLNVGVDGLSCPFCVYGLEKHLTKINTVRSVDVNLTEANVDVHLNPGTPLDLEAIRQAVIDSGFTLREVSIQVSGTVSKYDGFWRLESTGDLTPFVLTEQAHQALNGKLDDELSMAQGKGKTVTIWGKAHSHENEIAGIVVERFEVGDAR